MFENQRGVNKVNGHFGHNLHREVEAMQYQWQSRLEAVTDGLQVSWVNIDAYDTSRHSRVDSAEPVATSNSEDRDRIRNTSPECFLEQVRERVQLGDTWGVHVTLVILKRDIKPRARHEVHSSRRAGAAMRNLFGSLPYRSDSPKAKPSGVRSEEHTSELQSPDHIV